MSAQHLNLHTEMTHRLSRPSAVAAHPVSPTTTPKSFFFLCVSDELESVLAVLPNPLLMSWNVPLGSRVLIEPH